MNTSNIIITVGRQLGSGGREIATLLAKKSFLYLSTLVQRVWFLIPNSPFNLSVVRIFIVPRMRFPSPDYALLD